MGLAYSIAQTQAGRSVYQRSYRTLVPVDLHYCAYDGHYSLTEWEDKPALSNPRPEHGSFQLPAGIVFTVTGIKYRGGFIDSSPAFEVHIRLAEDVPLSTVQKRIRVRNILDYSQSPYEHVDPRYQAGDRVEELLDRRRDVLRLHGFQCSLYAWQFFPHDEVNTTIPLNPNPQLLVEVNSS